MKQPRKFIQWERNHSFLLPLCYSDPINLFQRFSSRAWGKDSVLRAQGFKYPCALDCCEAVTVFAPSTCWDHIDLAEIPQWIPSLSVLQLVCSKPSLAHQKHLCKVKTSSTHLKKCLFKIPFSKYYTNCSLCKQLKVIVVAGCSYYYRKSC